MSEEDRLEIIKCIKYVSAAFISVDEDKTVCKSLKRVRKVYPDQDLVFANGGDRAIGEVPESKVCLKHGIEMVDGLGEKIRSSSEMVKGVEGNE